MNERYKTFILLAHYKSFTETAKHLFCSQPTVSQHIQQLENELNCKLIVRHKRQIELTAQGEIVLQYAQKMQMLEKDLFQSIEEANDNKNMNLYLSHYIAGNYFHELFNKDNPICRNCPVAINSYSYEELRCSLLENRAKFAVMPIYDADSVVKNQFDIDILFEEELVLVLSKDHTLANRQVIFARDLKNEQILLPQSEYLTQSIKQAINEKQVPVYYNRMSNFEIIKKAIIQGLGVSFLPLKTIEENLDQLTYKQIKGLSIKRKNGIVFNRAKQLNEQEKAFCEHIKSIYS